MSNKSSKFYCENCGAEVKPNAKFCSKCGKFFTYVRCPVCNYTGPASAFVHGCPNCGYAINKKKEKVKSVNKSEGSLPLWIYIITFLILVCSIFFIILYLKQ